MWRGLALLDGPRWTVPMSDAFADHFFDVVPDLLCGPNCGRSCNGKTRRIWDEFVQPEVERLRNRIHEAVDECQRRYAPDVRELARLRNVREQARRDYDQHGDKSWAYISEIQRAYIADLTDQRDAALAALDRVRALCDDAETSHRPYSRILDVNDVRAALDGPGE